MRASTNLSFYYTRKPMKQQNKLFNQEIALPIGHAGIILFTFFRQGFLRIFNFFL